MNNRTRLLAPLLAALLIAGLAGCQTQTPVQRLAAANQTVALALNSASDLRDAGVLPQADLDAAKPAVDAYFKAKAEAERQIRAAQTAKAEGKPYNVSDVDNAIKQALAALPPLAPYFAKIDAAKAKPKPATRSTTRETR